LLSQYSENLHRMVLHCSHAENKHHQSTQRGELPLI
jgi:hypothetical protein